MSVSNADTRKLSFPLQNPEVVVGDTPNDGTPILQIDWPTTDNDEKIDVTFNLSLNEFVALASAIDVGRDIAYGVDTNLIWWIWTRALIEGGTLTCEQIIDCIENDADTKAALMQYLLENGISPAGNNASSSDVTMTPAQSAENLLPADFTCDSPHMMAVSRKIVQELNDASADMFQSIELLTNTAEAGIIVTDGLPVADTLNNVAELIDWLLETITEQYLASYNSSSENTLACAIYCIMQEDCEITYHDLISVMETYANPSDPFPETSDFQAIADWFMNLDTTIGLGIVATWFWVLLQAMRFGSGTIFELAGLTGLKSIIDQNAGLVDYSFDECDDCPPSETPTAYWLWEWDGGMGTQGSVESTTPDSVFENGGWNGRTISSNTQFGFAWLTPFGATPPTYYVAKVAMTQLRRGSAGSGTFDYMRLDVYPNTGLTGTSTRPMNINFLTEDGNQVYRSTAALPDNTYPMKSIAFAGGVSGSYLPPTRMVRGWHVRIWGHNHSNQKPPNSVWVANLDD